MTDAGADMCGFCGQLGADKVPHPVRWPGEESAGTEYVHADCENEECQRAHSLLNDQQRQQFMTDAGWTAGKPTEAGWYWFRTEVTEEEICHIYQDADDVWWATCTEWDEVYKLDDVLIGAEFLGPLSPSTYHQGRVAGLRDGIEAIRKREAYYEGQERGSAGKMRMTRGLQRNEASGCAYELERLLEQQAQEDQP